MQSLGLSRNLVRPLLLCICTAVLCSSLPASGAVSHAGQTISSLLKKPAADSSVGELSAALAAGISADPEGAAGYLEAVLLSGQKFSCQEVAAFVVTGIKALEVAMPANGAPSPAPLKPAKKGAKGKVQAATPLEKGVLSLVTVAVKLDEACATTIVSAAVSTAPGSMANKIVEAAVAALRNPGQFVKEDGKLISLAEAIAGAALQARPELDFGALSAAADRGISQQLESAFPGKQAGVTTNSSTSSGTRAVAGDAQVPPETINSL